MVNKIKENLLNIEIYQEEMKEIINQMAIESENINIEFLNTIKKLKEVI